MLGAILEERFIGPAVKLVHMFIAAAAERVD
jgi:hypothetical protein